MCSKFVIDLEEQLHLIKNYHLGKTCHRRTEETLSFQRNYAQKCNKPYKTTLCLFLTETLSKYFKNIYTDNF